jgi:methyltransferase (TIGR00027 family)
MDVAHPVARTAFYCCVIRADDAASARPMCGDTFAGRFLDEEVRRDLAPLLRMKQPAAGNVARHRLIDDIVRSRLAAEPASRVILIGAGFDTRAFRMAGGRWFELDDPQLLAFKEQRLPAADAPNPLSRIAVSFQSEPPDRYLTALAGDDEVLVILEGVSMYLSDQAIEALVAALSRLLPKATLVCDLMSPAFARSFSRGLRLALEAMGAKFGGRAVHPSRTIERGGYRALSRQSIVERARQAGSVSIPRWLLGTFLRELRDGYAVWTFSRVRP